MAPAQAFRNIAAPKANKYGHLQLVARAGQCPCGFHGIPGEDRQLARLAVTLVDSCLDLAIALKWRIDARVETIIVPANTRKSRVSATHDKMFAMKLFPDDLVANDPRIDALSA